jgi:hypothetical protein
VCVAPPILIQRDGGVNQPFQKRSLGLGRREPRPLENLVGLKELAARKMVSPMVDCFPDLRIHGRLFPGEAIIPFERPRSSSLAGEGKGNARQAAKK